MNRPHVKGFRLGAILIISLALFSGVTYLICQKGLASTEFQSGPCGVAPGSTVDERIRDCSEEKQAKGFDWRLVTRTDQGVEIWRDEASKLLVSQKLSSRKTWNELMEVKEKGWDRINPFVTKAVEREPAYCRAAETLQARGNLKDISWHLPSKKDFKDLEDHGVREILPFMETDWFWSSSPSSFPFRAWYFDGDDGVVYVGYVTRDYLLAVVCVAR